MATKKTSPSRERLTTLEARNEWTREQLSKIRAKEEAFTKAKEKLTMARQAVVEAHEELKNGLSKDLQMTIVWGNQPDEMPDDPDADEPEDIIPDSKTKASGG